MLGRLAQVYTLEKVLRVKKDPASGMAFLDEAMKVRRLLSPTSGLRKRLNQSTFH